MHQELIATYETERLKTLSVWSCFRDEDLPWRPADMQHRGRSVHEQMVHQCVSENAWFANMFGIKVADQPLPSPESRIGFIEIYAVHSRQRLEQLRSKRTEWWGDSIAFFEVPRSRAWVMIRRLTHSAHHRGQLTAYLRMLGRSVYSTYGPTSDTGGLMQHKAPVIYPYENDEKLIDGETGGLAAKRQLPGPPKDKPYTERP
jgi:uncharacterized damage-inducible protein DinB